MRSWSGAAPTVWRPLKGDLYDPKVPDIATHYRELKKAVVIFSGDAAADAGGRGVQPVMSRPKICREMTHFCTSFAPS